MVLSCSENKAAIQMIIFYSGEGSRSNPEIVLGEEARIMLTFHNMYQDEAKPPYRPDSRFKRILKAHKKARKRCRKSNGKSS